MKKILCFMAIACVVLVGCTSDEVSVYGDVYGIVSDLKSGAPVRNAEVVISPGNASTVSGSDGHFEFKSLTPGQYKISVEANGYSSNSRQVTVVAGQRISCDIHLAPEADNDVISINPTSIDFGTNELQIAATVTNESDSETEWFLDLGDTPWLYAYPTTGRIGGGKTHSIVFTANRARMNEDKSSVVNISAFGNTHPLSLKCKQSVQLSSVMVVESLNVDFGEEATEQIIRIRNVSETDVNWTLYKVQSERLSMSSTHGIVAPGGSQIVTIRLDREGLDEVLATTFMISDGTVDQPVNVIAYPTPEGATTTNKIFYTSIDGNIVEPNDPSAFGANIVSNVYENGQGVITFDGEVTSIGEGTFADCSGLTSITIPDAVTLIGSYTFADCSGLISITIPDAVTSIGEGAFSCCANLSNFNGKYATTDGKALVCDNKLIAFAPAGMTSYTTPENITSIGCSVFRDCDEHLTSVTLPNGLTSIGADAFYNCSSLTSINIPDAVTSIGEWTFAHCSGLTSITIPDAVTLIGSYTFVNCSGLTSIDIPDGVTSIGKSAFWGCSGLTSINIPDGVTSIEGGTFYNCSSLTSINIPDAVTSIGEMAFWGCSGLTSIEIPDGVTLIGSYTFYNCSGLTSITIPDGLTSIGESAFDGCSGLTSITIPNGVTSIGSYTFYNCSGLTSITIPDGVTSIGTRAFGCTSLTSVTIPNSVTSIGRAAFEACDNLEEFKGKFASDDGRYLIVDGVLNSHASLNGATSITIPSNVSIIGERVFWLAGMTSVVIPSSVVSIEDGAFNWATSINAVYCEISTPPALGSQVFDYNATGRIIYVPTASVDAYKVAENWSEYADAIVGYDF